MVFPKKRFRRLLCYLTTESFRLLKDTDDGWKNFFSLQLLSSTQCLVKRKKVWQDLVGKELSMSEKIAQRPTSVHWFRFVEKEGWDVGGRNDVLWILDSDLCPFSTTTRSGEKIEEYSIWWSMIDGTIWKIAGWPNGGLVSGTRNGNVYWNPTYASINQEISRVPSKSKHESVMKNYPKALIWSESHRTRIISAELSLR